MVNETTPGANRGAENNHEESAMGKDDGTLPWGKKGGSLIARAHPAMLTQAPAITRVACVINMRQRAGPRTLA